MSSSSSRPQVTITLGHTGQVVKRTGSISDVCHTDFKPLSGSKRPIRERLGNNIGDTHSYGSLPKDKRQRTEDRNGSLKNGDLGDSKKYMPSSGVGRDDLRYKLLRKSISKRTYTAPDQCSVDLREKLSHNCRGSLRFDAQQHVLESRSSGDARRSPPIRRAEELDSLRKSYNFTSNGLRNGSPDRLLGTSRGMPSPRYYDDLRHAPSMRSVDASRSVNFTAKNAIDASRPGPLVSKATISVDTAKPVMRAALARDTSRKNSYMSEEPSSVASLLHSLGLGKYAIIFQAEEVDMPALKQMGDSDLKELGIPMGPRKKILLAVSSRSKQRHS